MKIFLWIVVAILIIAHQDTWNWESKELVFGFMPIGMAYHVLISILAAVVWLFAVNFAWPEDLENEDQTSEAKP